jgi:predicted RNase H-like HicB family nuclease
LASPFSKRVRTQAEQIVSEYQLILTQEAEVGYLGRTVEMPLVMANGETVEACVRETLAATVAAVATLLELGEKTPLPARQGKRDQQVNIRLSSEEKMILEDAARREGFRSLSDFLRSSALNRAG